MSEKQRREAYELITCGTLFTLFCGLSLLFPLYDMLLKTKGKLWIGLVAIGPPLMIYGFILLNRSRRDRPPRTPSQRTTMRIPIEPVPHKKIYLPDEKFDPNILESLEFFTRQLQPGLLLLNLEAKHRSYQQSPAWDGEEFCDEYGYAATGASRHPEEVAEMQRLERLMQAQSPHHRGFQDAVALLRPTGLRIGFGGTGEYSGDGRVLRVCSTVGILQKLEELAATVAGYGSAEERAEASREFWRYMDENYHPDWEANRARASKPSVNPYRS